MVLKSNTKQAASTMAKRLSALKSNAAVGDVRLDRRTTTSLTGVLLVNGSETAYPCEIQDISTGGARINLDETYLLKERATLTIESGAQKTCRIAWQRGTVVGLAF